MMSVPLRRRILIAILGIAILSGLGCERGTEGAKAIVKADAGAYGGGIGKADEGGGESYDGGRFIDSDGAGEADSDISKAEPTIGRAMWAWDTGRYLENPGLWEELLVFCRERGIVEVFLQIQTLNDEEAGRRVIREPGVMRALLRRASEEGIRVHALDGDPSFALRAQHDLVIELVDAVIDYNAESAVEERYVAIRMDVEPYSLSEWGEDRTHMMLEWLEMNAKVVSHLEHRAPTLAYGIDIPFWLDSIEEDGGELTFGVEYNGVYQDLARHFIDMVDNVGIMAYRQEANGPNGIIALSQGELGYASQSGGARVFVGVETMAPDPPGIPASITFGDRDRAFMEAVLEAVQEAVADYTAFEGIAIHHYESYRMME